MNDRITYNGRIAEAISAIRDEQIETDNGMSEELFLMISSLIPIPNVDLLITNNLNQILLSRRDDGFYEKSWHIPGGCMRYGESFDTRIQETAIRELGTKVVYNPEPIAVRNVIRGNNLNQKYPRERGHTVAVLFSCRLPDGFCISNHGKSEQDDGFLRWYDTLPSDFLKIQHVFDDILDPWIP